MKLYFTLILGFVTASLFGQSNKAVKLNWKILPDEKVAYRTVMSDIDSSSVEMNFGELFRSLSDTTNKGLDESKQFFRKLNQSFKNYDLITTLTNKGNDIVNIEMTTRSNTKSNENNSDSPNKQSDDLVKMVQKTNQGVVIRGAVYATGGIQSFWVKSNQKNLISILFELPTKPVAIGDSWPLDVNLIGNDENFICDSSYKINKVTLQDIKQVNGETVAVLKYEIVEFVKGNFNVPSFFGSGGPKETVMRLSHHALAEFSVDRGRWISYDGIMTLYSSGVMTANTKTKFTLTQE